jgi:hypothetical protein
MTKHDIDPTTQASMLPPTPAGLALGAVIEMEGGYYQAATTEAEPSQELAALKAENVALEFLGRAAATEQRISNMSRGKYALEKSGVDESKQFNLAGNIERSEVTKARFKRVAKKHFALSIGIETKEVTSTEFRPAKGIEEEVIKVEAKESDRQPELSSRYREFLATYKGSQKQREKRRAEIAEQIGEVKV